MSPVTGKWVVSISLRNNARSSNGPSGDLAQLNARDPFRSLLSLRMFSYVEAPE